MILMITPEIQIPSSELSLSYARSSGPGGQNVNKVNSKAILRWDLASSPSLTPEIRARLWRRLHNQINADGTLVITSDRFRDQLRNREDCFEKFKLLIAAAAFVPKRRKKTKPSFSSQRKMKEGKAKHSQKKRLRRASRDFD